jgi:hypothetical protein
MRSLYLLAIAALLFGGAVAQDYATCVAACPQGGGAGYARGVCISGCADQYSNQREIDVADAHEYLREYQQCVAGCPSGADAVIGDRRGVCLSNCGAWLNGQN